MGPAGGQLRPEGGGGVQQPAGGHGGSGGWSRPCLAGQLQAKGEAGTTSWEGAVLGDVISPWLVSCRSCTLRLKR